jgi:hypothetical protein
MITLKIPDISRPPYQLAQLRSFIRAQWPKLFRAAFFARSLTPRFRLVAKEFEVLDRFASLHTEFVLLPPPRPPLLAGDVGAAPGEALDDGEEPESEPESEPDEEAPEDVAELSAGGSPELSADAARLETGPPGKV